MSGDANYQVVAEVGRALQFGLHDIARKVRELLVSGAWREFVDARGNAQSYDDFEVFVTAPSSRGLNSDVRTLQKVCHDQRDVLDLIDQALQRPRGGDHRSNVDNINVARPTGTSQQRALRKLRTSRPDLHVRVVAGEMSPHAAMIEAGFRRRTITVPADPEEMAHTLLRRLEPDELRRLLEAIVDGAGV